MVKKAPTPTIAAIFYVINFFTPFPYLDLND